MHLPIAWDEPPMRCTTHKLYRILIGISLHKCTAYSLLQLVYTSDAIAKTHHHVLYRKGRHFRNASATLLFLMLLILCFSSSPAGRDWFVGIGGSHVAV